MIPKVIKRYFCESVGKTPVRVRYAPSPTGKLHIGGLRTALYNYLFAKKHDGKFILRIEDTDKAREVPGSVDDIIYSLKWAGIEWDEGPGASEDTNYGPYYQSHRLKKYNKIAHRLVQLGEAYHCFCTPERLQNLKEEQQKNKKPSKYDQYCRNLPESQINENLKSKVPYTIRLAVPSRGSITVEDMLHGNVNFDYESIDDQILLKTDGYPTYHLANVIDDFEMEISHVIRGEEWLTSLPKHVLLYKAMGLKIPKFVHLPLILNPTGGKLSKRNPYTSVSNYIEKDFCPEAVINYVGLMGWMPSFEEDIKYHIREYKDELLSLKDMEQMFSVEKINPTNAKLDEKKLLFFNGFYIRKKLSPFDNIEKVEEKLPPKAEKLLVWVKQMFIKHAKVESALLDDFSLENWVFLIKLFKNRIRGFEELQHYAYLFEDPDFTTERADKSMNKVFRDRRKSATILADLDELLSKKIDTEEFNSARIVQEIGTYIQNCSEDLSHENIYHLLRFVLSASHEGIPASDIAQILGRDETLKRIKVWI